MAPVAGSTIAQPELLPASRRAVISEVHSHVRGFTPEWTNLRTSDAGAAMVQLFGEQMEPVLERLNLLPRKSLIEFLDITGAKNLAATPAEAMLEFTIADGAPESVLIPVGFQVSAPPASGEGDPVVFETEFSLYGAPSKIDKIYVQEGGTFLEVDTKSTSPFQPFGAKPIPGRSLLLGLSGDVAPSRFLSLGIGIAAVAGTPPPASAGGIDPVPVAPALMLRWEVLDGASYEPAEVVRDETGGLYRSGIVELSLPRRWRPGRPEGLEDKADALRWLRLRIVYGQYSESPRFSFVRLNVTRAVATRTIRDEVLEPVPDSKGRQMRVSQTPVISKSLILEIDDGNFDSPLGLESAPVDDVAAEVEAGIDRTSSPDAEPPSAFGRRWKEVDDLLDWGSEAEVFVLEPETGIVTFGDGVSGAALPKGFRHVRAARYRVGGGAAGAVEADTIQTMLSSAAFVSSVTNPQPASGGTDRESQQNAVRRGPQEFRARGRAVTVADYDLMAMRAPGAQIVRAHAVSGFHPSLPGKPIPGVVGVYVVPPDRNEGPPTPDENALRAVSDSLSKKLAPLGVEIVVAAPRYHRIKAIAGVVIDPAFDQSDIIRRLLNELNTYLHPLTGGEDGQGWPFGQTLQYTVLIRRLLARIRGLLAVSTLNFVVDGFRILGCKDVVPSANALFWPEGHDVIVLESEESL
jgi:predicted phage baseplate assembly protein